MAAVYILPQYLANLTQPIGAYETIFFWESRPSINNIACARFEVFRTFKCVFTSIFLNGVSFAKSYG